MSIPEEGPNVMAKLIDVTLLEYARTRTSPLALVPTLDEVRAKLSRVQASMAELIISEREEF